MPTLVATPWPRGPVVVSMPEVQRPRALAVELAEMLDVVERDRQLAEPLVVRIGRLDARGVQQRVQRHRGVAHRAHEALPDSARPRRPDSNLSTHCLSV